VAKAPIPAAGEVPYQYLEIPTNLTEDKWVQAFEVKAGDPKVLHHVIVYARPPATPAPAQPAAPTSQSATHPRVPPRIPAHYRRPDRARNTAFSLAFVIYSPWGLW